MTESELHPMRCETCGHHKLVGKIPDIDECDILDHTPTRSDMKLIRSVGCASYTRVTEREAELEKFECICYKCKIKSDVSGEFCHGIKAIRADAIAAERERMLEEVYNELLSSDETRGDCMRDAIRVINSLRRS